MHTNIGHISYYDISHFYGFYTSTAMTNFQNLYPTFNDCCIDNLKEKFSFVVKRKKKDNTESWNYGKWAVDHRHEKLLWDYAMQILSHEFRKMTMMMDVTESYRHLTTADEALWHLSDSWEKVKKSGYKMLK